MVAWAGYGKPVVCGAILNSGCAHTMTPLSWWYWSAQQDQPSRGRSTGNRDMPGVSNVSVVDGESGLEGGQLLLQAGSQLQ